MLHQLTIPKKKTVEAAFDHRQLHALGLQHVQRLAGRIWTDYNVHDPGITTLELLCYALTDLANRASFPVEDLLASADGNPAKMREQFFTAREILPNRPLTLLDYRKLLIDLPGVKNAWLLPAPLTLYADTVEGELLREDPGRPGIREIALSGLWEVVIEYMDDVTSPAQKGEILRRVEERLQANRSLCEDYVRFTEVEPQSFLLCCELEIAPEADAAKVKAEILFRVQEYLAPAVRNYSLSEMLERRKADGTPWTAAEIFDGPRLHCGFIDDEELERAELRGRIRLSDIIGIIMDIEGVFAVRDIVVSPEGICVPLEDKWVVPVERGRKALLNRDRSRLVFYKRNMPIVPGGRETEGHYRRLAEAARSKAEAEFPYDLEIPSGRFREPGSYTSIQNHFPAVYGLSDLDRESLADEGRKALAWQMKGYLLFFDQIMADYLAELGRVKELFSLDPDLHRTFFHQVVDSFADYERIYAADDIAASLENAAADGAVQLERRNRFLDHLIARFAERFTEFASLMHSVFGAGGASMVACKCAFLRDYPAISSERALAYNAALAGDGALWNSENVSGLEKRLARLLGISNFSRRNLGDVAYDIYAEVDETPGDEFRFRIRDRENGKILLSSSTRYPTSQAVKAEMRRAILFGSLPRGYQRRKTSNGKYYFNVIDDTGEVIARRIEYFDTEERREEAILELADYLRANYSDEGMYLIENILLRPQGETDPFLPVCSARDRNACADFDPYSHRLHIILPAYGSRFGDIDFRRFAEEIIREETPSHILPKICWIGREDMARLEKEYRDWVFLKAGRETAGRREKLSSFIEILYAVKNVYPSRKLYECDSGEEHPRFILGRTALGSAEEGGS